MYVYLFGVGSSKTTFRNGAIREKRLFYLGRPLDEGKKWKIAFPPNTFALRLALTHPLQTRARERDDDDGCVLYRQEK